MDQAASISDAIVKRLRATSDAKEKMIVAGLIRRPMSEGATKQECSTCIYFLPNHAFCDLPELQFPVDPDWWCRLWRI